MDSDDISIKDRCERQLEKFGEQPELDIVGSSVAEFIDDTDNIQAYRILPETDEEIKKLINYIDTHLNLTSDDVFEYVFSMQNNDSE